jgi:peptidoglycan/LPS O-acetylase OafA/YrhL
VENKNGVPALTSLRFIAAYLVLAGHVLPYWLGDSFSHWPGFLAKIVLGSYIAVPFFFTLSGFVLAWARDADSHGTLRFYQKRFARIAPLFYLSLVLHLPYMLLTINALAKVIEGKQAALIFFGNLFFLGAWDYRLLTLNPPGWSLSVEAFFYLLFPLLFILLGKLRSGWIPLALVLNFCLGAYLHTLGMFAPHGPGVAPGVHLPMIDFLHSNPLVHLNEFIAGILLARFYASRQNTWALISPFWLLLVGALGVVALLEMSDFLSDYALNSFLGTPFFCLLIWGGAELPKTNSWLASPAIVLLGEASYALYILQWPFFDWLKFASTAWAIPAWVSLFICMLGFPLGAVFFYQRVETPLRAWLLPKNR